MKRRSNVPASPIVTLYIACTAMEPATVASRSKARNVFARSTTGIVGSNPARVMDVGLRLSCVCVVRCR
jgi:hypothetical protein